MKLNRFKKVNKRLNFYVNSYNFRTPYQLLIDGTFCLAALNNQINIQDNIPRYLQNELKLLTTQCVLIETENLGSPVFGALIILKQYGIHKCGHEGKPIPGSDCLLSMIGKNNSKHYIVATQDRDLQTKIRNIPGAPLLYLHNKAPVLDTPSEVSYEVAKLNMNKKYGVTDSEMKLLQKLKEIDMSSKKITKSKKVKSKMHNTNKNTQKQK